MQNDHSANSELQFRPSPILPLKVLSKLIESRGIKATPRLGLRDSSHRKGYAPGQVVTMRLFDNEGKDIEPMSRKIRITAVHSKPLGEFSGADLRKSRCYSAGWRAVQHDLSFFESRPIGEKEVVSLIEFEYVAP